jgi:hypothetical protein
MSDFLSRMLRAITMSFDWPMSMWPISLVLCASATWAIFSLVKRELLSSKLILLATSFSAAFFIGSAAFIGTFWAVPAYPAYASQQRHAALLGGSWWAYFLVMALLVGFARGIRLPVAALASLMVWINFGIIFIGVMAVSGNWL